MRKLRLQLDDLLIESFDTTPVQKAKGTVFGEQCTCPTQCTCPGCPTCAASCNGTCDASCNGTCAASCNGTCGCGTWEVGCGGGDTYGQYTCGGWVTEGPRGHGRCS